MAIAAIGTGRATGGFSHIPASRKGSALFKVFDQGQDGHAAGGAEAEGDSLAGVAAVAGVVEEAGIYCVGIQTGEGVVVGVGVVPSAVVVQIQHIAHGDRGGTP